MACKLFPPLYTIAAIGSCAVRYRVSCSAMGIVSDSTSAYRYFVTFSFFTPFPSTGLNRIHAPASSFQSPIVAPMSSGCRRSPAMISAAVRSY